MASIRDLRTRIRSVGNIRQITRAMEMVATTKLRRFQDRAVASRPYAEEIAALLEHLAGASGPALAERALFRAGSGETSLVLLVSSDRGLCGAYNSNLFARFEAWWKAHKAAGKQARFYVIGRKGYQYLYKRGIQVERYLSDPPLEQIDYRLAKFVARTLAEAFTKGDLKDVWVVYTAFESMARYVPTFLPLLPVQGAAPTDARAGRSREAAREVDVILEPDAATLLDKLEPRYLETRVYNALLEAITSEYASRRMSMKNATDAAGEMQGLLKGQYNRKRQETITKELLDIVGGAEALR